MIAQTGLQERDSVGLTAAQMRRDRLSDRPRSLINATRKVEDHHLSLWQGLHDQALRAHQAFELAARGAALARHRGDMKRAETLTELARKQHQRWSRLSQAMTLYEQ